MLQTMFQGLQPFGSWEETFEVFYHIWAWRPSWSWPGPFKQTFFPPSHGGSIWYLTLIGQAVSEEKTFKVWTTTDWQRSCLYYKLTNEKNSSVELKMKGLFTFLAPLMRNRNFSYSTTGWASNRLVGLSICVTSVKWWRSHTEAQYKRFKWATSWQNLLMPHANNKGADQPAHLRSLISAFVFPAWIV